jgi:hypothetical protein
MKPGVACSNHAGDATRLFYGHFGRAPNSPCFTSSFNGVAMGAADYPPPYPPQKPNKVHRLLAEMMLLNQPDQPVIGEPSTHAEM